MALSEVSKLRVAVLLKILEGSSDEVQLLEHLLNLARQRRALLLQQRRSVAGVGERRQLPRWFADASLSNIHFLGPNALGPGHGSNATMPDSSSGDVQESSGLQAGRRPDESSPRDAMYDCSLRGLGGLPTGPHRDPQTEGDQV